MSVLIVLGFGPQCPQRFGLRRAVRQKPLAQAHGPQRQRSDSVDDAIDTQYELERSAADVRDHSPTAPELEMCERAAEAQASFFVAVEHPNVEARLRVHAMDESRAVRGVAHGARGDGFDSLSPELSREGRHAHDVFDRAVHRRFVENPGVDETGREPRRSLHFIDDLDATSGRDIGNDLANRIRSDVDRRDPARIALAQRRGGSCHVGNVVGGWWLVAGGWWLVAGGWWLVAGGLLRAAIEVAATSGVGHSTISPRCPTEL